MVKGFDDNNSNNDNGDDNKKLFLIYKPHHSHILQSNTNNSPVYMHFNIRFEQKLTV